ncbi:MAG: SixA phosphatase family protein [Hyphomicrobium sp.]
MLTLALLRHAKSSWEEPGLDDFDRPLNARGEATAPLMGAALGNLGFDPDLVICSPSQRTRQTLDRASPMFVRGKPRIVFDERLYLASAGDLLGIVRETAPGPTYVLVIGHNPGLHTLAVNLAGTGSAAELGRMTDKFPTAALALLTFEATKWSDISPGDGRLETFITPKSLS